MRPSIQLCPAPLTIGIASLARANAPVRDMHGRCMGDAWEMHGRCMADAWQHGRGIAAPARGGPWTEQNRVPTCYLSGTHTLTRILRRLARLCHRCCTRWPRSSTRLVTPVLRSSHDCDVGVEAQEQTCKTPRAYCPFLSIRSGSHTKKVG